MANTYTLIASSTVGAGGAANISFTSIPATYTDLVVKFSARNVSSSNVFGIVGISLNGVTANLTAKILYGYGSGTGSLSASGNPGIWTYQDSATSTASTFGNGEVYIPNYAGSTYKSMSLDGVNENNATDGRQTLTAGLWSDTSAITSVQLTSFDSGLAASNFAQYSTAYLYGVKSS